MFNKHQLAKNIKRVLFGATESYCFSNNKLKFELGTRPIRRKYIHSNNGVVRNDLLQIEFFENNFKPENTLWDVGSHFGHYSILCASIAKGTSQIFSFEPDSFAASIQRRNIELNRLGNKIQLYDKAVSDVDGTTHFNNQKGNSNSTIVKDPNKTQLNNVDVVGSVTLNSLAEELPPPSFIKIDVEGAEINILKKADQLLADPGVCFICELHPFAWKDFDVSYTNLTDILKNHNRKLYLLDTKRSKAELPFYGTVVF